MNGIAPRAAVSLNTAPGAAAAPDGDAADLEPRGVTPPQQPTDTPKPDPVDGFLAVLADRDPAKASSATEQARKDPPAEPGRNGWTPETIIEVRTNFPKGLTLSMLRLAVGNVDERPGQRLSTGMIDKVAPYLAEAFQLDEGFVRGELGKVYLYIGGPATNGNALTIGHHIYVENAKDLERILSKDKKAWLVHEMAHVIQYAKYNANNPHSFLADYVKALAIGHDPAEPGSGVGQTIWGALFTGWKTFEDPGTSKNGAGQTRAGDLGTPATTIGQRLSLSLLPASVVGISTGLAAGGAIAAVRLLNRRVHHAQAGGPIPNIFGKARSVRTGLGLVAAPIIAGSLVGVSTRDLGTAPSNLLGAAAGVTLGVTTMALAKGFRGMGKHLRGGHITALAGVALAGSLGFAGARVSSNTVDGWSNSADLVAANQSRHGGVKERGLVLAVHDSHWLEIDAEAIARRFTNNKWKSSEAKTYPGKLPKPPDTLGDRLDWGLWNPLIFGIPAAAAAGTVVFGARLIGAASYGMRHDEVASGFRAAGRRIASHSRGVPNSFGIGAAVTLAPLLIAAATSQGINLTGVDRHSSKGVGAVTGAVASGVLVTALLRRGGPVSVLRTTPKVIAAMAIGGAAGFLSASVNVGAVNNRERVYDVAKGTSATR